MAKNLFLPTPGTVYFIGAGPGATDLITLRGRDLIAQADLILYADSLVSEQITHFAQKPNVQIVGSANLHLEQILALMIEVVRKGGIVARVHTGDPALYGAIYEQIALLEAEKIPYEVIPGVPSAFAAAACLKAEMTIPDLVQTFILTRAAGRTPVPPTENLPSLAAHGASLAIHLSVKQIEKVVNEVLAGKAYTLDTPVAVLYKVTWADEQVIIGTLADIGQKVQAAGLTKHALIIISPALDPKLKIASQKPQSRLYAKDFSHEYRQAQGQTTLSYPLNELKNESKRERVVIAITKRGALLAAKLALALNADLRLPAKFADLNPKDLDSQRFSAFSSSVKQEIAQCWPQYQQLILLMATGIAVRAIAPLLQHKTHDPALICLDEQGQAVIPLLGGHKAGANALAKEIATLTGGFTAITTASDGQKKLALDLLGQEEGWKIAEKSAITHTLASFVNDDLLGIYVAEGLTGARARLQELAAENVVFVENIDDLASPEYAAGLIVSHQMLTDQQHKLLQKSILYHPPVLVAGIGCRKDISAAELDEALTETLLINQLAFESLAALATVDLKETELGLLELAQNLKLPLQFVPQAQLKTLDSSAFSPSAAQEKFGLPGVAEPCALVVSEGKLIVSKQIFLHCTVAIALKTKN